MEKHEIINEIEFLLNDISNMIDSMEEKINRLYKLIEEKDEIAVYLIDFENLEMFKKYVFVQKQVAEAAKKVFYSSENMFEHNGEVLDAHLSVRAKLLETHDIIKKGQAKFLLAYCEAFMMLDSLEIDDNLSM